MTQRHELRRQLSWLDGTAIFVGIILGSGIFVAPAGIAAGAVTLPLASVLWIVGGIIATAGAFCYAECGARLPQTGGFYVYYREAFGEGTAFVGGWAAVLITYPASMAAIARAPAAFDAAVPMAGIYDFADAYSTADRLGRIFIRTGHGGAPEETPDVYAISDTLARLGNVQTPLLLMHGEADVRAPFRQFELAVATLRGAGIPLQSHSYPDEPHGFRDPNNRIDMYRRLERFFDEHLRK